MINVLLYREMYKCPEKPFKMHLCACVAFSDDVSKQGRLVVRAIEIAKKEVRSV